jgi:UDP-perosamine 4-acetyltransferase
VKAMMNVKSASVARGASDDRAELVVLGTGGHARSCLDVLAAAQTPVRGCVGGAPAGPLQAPYLGPDDCLADLLADGYRICLVAIGDNATRMRVSTELLARGFTLATVVSPGAYVAPTATLGPGSIVMHGAVVGAYAAIGTSCILNTGASIDHDCNIGNYSHIGPGGRLAGTVVLGTGSFLGVGSVVIPGVSIADWTVVGAGAAVIRDITASSRTLVGVPAEEVRKHIA